MGVRFGPGRRRGIIGGGSSTTPPIIDQLSAAPTGAWSSRKLSSGFAGTPLTSSAGTITKYSDQIASNDLTAVGSPALDTGGINTNNFSTMNGTSNSYTMGSSIVCTADFDVWAAIGGIAANPTSRAFLGRAGNAGPYLRVQGSTGILISSRSDAGSNADITPTANYKKGFHVWRWTRIGSTLTAYIDGVSQGTATVSGTCTFNTVGLNNVSAFLSGGFGEMLFYNGSTLGSTDAGILLPNMLAAWKSPVYVDSVAGNNTNAGWNSATALADFTDMCTLAFTPGQKFFVNSGSTYVRKQIFVAQSNANGSSTSPITIDIYGGTTPALLDGAEALTSGWTNVLGDVWAHTGVSTGFGGANSPCCWLIDGTTTFRFTSIGAVYGSLTQGQSAVLTTTLQICMPTAYTGLSPNSYTIKHAASIASQSDDNLHFSNTFWTVNNIKSMYSAGDGLRINGNGCNANSTIAWYNGQDGHGYGLSGAAVTTCTTCDSQFNGAGLALSGTAGDGFSAHGPSIVTLISCTASNNDKSSFNHEEATTIVQTNCIGLGSNLALNLLDQPGSDTPGNWTITGGSYSRRSGSSILYVVGALSSDHTGGSGSAGGATMTFSGVTLIDPENANNTIGYYAPSTSYVDVTATNTTFGNPPPNAHSQNLGHGTFIIA